jgi:hypothetical protein
MAAPAAPTNQLSLAELEQQATEDTDQYWDRAA